MVMLSINTDVLALHKTHVAVKIQLGLRTRVQIRAGTRTTDESGAHEAVEIRDRRILTTRPSGYVKERSSRGELEATGDRFGRSAVRFRHC